MCKDTNKVVAVQGDSRLQKFRIDCKSDVDINLTCYPMTVILRLSVVGDSRLQKFRIDCKTISSLSVVGDSRLQKFRIDWKSDVDINQTWEPVTAISRLSSTRDALAGLLLNSDYQYRPHPYYYTDRRRSGAASIHRLPVTLSQP
ncbi:hypothetical protein J6590_032799 [Homalodisca vitripennis]|nr:hypothetical protein J6590_032799 [Homalodisca vitripennis]